MRSGACGSVTAMPRDHASAHEQVERALARLEDRESELHAFAHVDAEGARAQARDLDDAAARDGGSRGPLGGMPIGVKDVIDTADQPTALGSPLFAGRAPQRDAACVALLRRAGGVVLGKTVTAELAAFDPGPTRNPHDPARTPGGSSSGSAAAVAAGIVPAALGTQTAGSVIRPAAFCGVVGCKPSFGLVPRSGVLSFADSLDTVGVLASRLDVAARVLAAIADRDDLLPGRWPEPSQRLRLGVCRTPDWAAVEPAARTALERIADAAASSGALVTDVEPGPAFADAAQAQRTLQLAEGSLALADERCRHPRWLSGTLRSLLDEGAATTPAERDAAHATARRAARELDAATAEIDVLLTPAASGEAPQGLGSTGDPLHNRRWTLLGVPALSLPAGVGPAGMPLAVQLIGRRGEDAALLAAAADLLRRVEGGA